jgi:hypothetical protein
LLLNWQPRCDLGHLRVVVGKNLQLQLASCFDGKAGMILSKRAAFGLPRLSMPNRITGAGYNEVSVETLAFVMSRAPF